LRYTHAKEGKINISALVYFHAMTRLSAVMQGRGIFSKTKSYESERDVAKKRRRLTRRILFKGGTVNGIWKGDGGGGRFMLTM